MLLKALGERKSYHHKVLYVISLRQFCSRLCLSPPAEHKKAEWSAVRNPKSATGRGTGLRELLLFRISSRCAIGKWSV